MNKRSIHEKSVHMKFIDEKFIDEKSSWPLGQLIGRLLTKDD